eukprot:g4153.t1
MRFQIFWSSTTTTKGKKEFCDAEGKLYQDGLFMTYTTDDNKAPKEVYRRGRTTSGQPLGYLFNSQWDGGSWVQSSLREVILICVACI